MPFFLWLRFLDRPAAGRRCTASTWAPQMRDAGREVSLYRGAMPEATSASLAAQLLGRLTSPSQAAIRAERQIRLQEALNSMDPIDREVLALRHFEELSNAEAAAVLGLDKSAASKRYVRALRRLKEILGRPARRPRRGARPMSRRRIRRPRPDRRGWPRSSSARYRRGERPSARASTPRSYPELADEIRELLPGPGR